jgi:hypothetical protein
MNYFEEVTFRSVPDVHARLAQDFPLVPIRVIADVLKAYQEVTPTLSQAAAAARDRIEDARAT